MKQNKVSISTRSSARWATISHAVKIALQLISIAIFARFLTPADYGLMALASVFTTLAYSLRDLGTSPAIIQRENLDDEFESTVLVVNVVSGFSLFLALIAAAYPASHIFSAPRLTTILLLLSPIFLLSSLSILQQAKMEKAGEFKGLAAIEISSALLGICTGVVAAYCGAGVYSLVVQALTSTCVTTGLILGSRRRNWPEFKPSRSALSNLMKTSGSLTLYALIYYLRGAIDVSIIGRMFGNTILGNYNIATKVVTNPIQNIAWTVARALLPSMSAFQHDSQKLQGLYLRSLGVVAFVCFPALLGLWSLSEVFTVVVLGEKWRPAATLLSWIAPIGLMNVIDSASGTVLVAKGRPHVLLILTICSTAFMAVFLALGSQFSMQHAMHGLLTAAVFSTALSLSQVCKNLKMHFLAIGKVLLPITMAACFAALTMSYVANDVLASSKPLTRLLFACLAGLVTYGLSSWVFARKSLLDAWSIIQKKSARPTP